MTTHYQNWASWYNFLRLVLKVTRMRLKISTPNGLAPGNGKQEQLKSKKVDQIKDFVYWLMHHGSNCNAGRVASASE